MASGPRQARAADASPGRLRAHFHQQNLHTTLCPTLLLAYSSSHCVRNSTSAQSNTVLGIVLEILAKVHRVPTRSVDHVTRTRIVSLSTVLNATNRVEGLAIEHSIRTGKSCRVETITATLHTASTRMVFLCPHGSSVIVNWGVSSKY